MAKKNHPVIDNPLASMGLDDIVRGITSPKPAVTPEPETATPEAEEPEDIEPVVEETVEITEEVIETPRKTSRRRGNMKLFEENLAKYTGISEQGIAIWMPKEVKKRLELIRINADRNIPLRSLAAAIIMTYIAENEDKLDNL